MNITLSLHFTSRFVCSKTVINPKAHHYHQSKMSKKYITWLTSTEYKSTYSRANISWWSSIFQLQVLLAFSCTRCWWSDMLLTEQEFFRYQIQRKNHFRPEQSFTATNLFTNLSQQWRITVLVPVLLDPSRGEIRWVQAQGYVKGYSLCFRTAKTCLCETANRRFSLQARDILTF